MPTRKIQVKRSVKNIEEIKDNLLDFGEPLYIEDSNYFTIGDSQLSKIDNLKVSKLVDKSIADRGVYFDEQKSFVDDTGSEIELGSTASRSGLVKHEIKSITIGRESWQKTNTYVDFPWRGEILFTGCTVNHIPNVIFGYEDVRSGNFAPISSTENGKVYIYARTQPTKNITIPAIEITE